MLFQSIFDAIRKVLNRLGRDRLVDQQDLLCTANGPIGQNVSNDLPI
jgi:hypothetical protein